MVVWLVKQAGISSFSNGVPEIIQLDRIDIRCSVPHQSANPTFELSISQSRQGSSPTRKIPFHTALWVGASLSGG